MPNVEDVFCLSGVPTYTFVEPARYNEIKVALRTPGRCVVIEGPSGIGKTTTVVKALSEIGQEANTLTLSARRSADVELIAELPDMKKIGTVIVDDFHRLDEKTKGRLSDFMKTLADSGTPESKLILIGINKAGQQLIKFAHDLGLRMDVFRLEANPEEKLLELVDLGETALNISIPIKDEIAKRAQGSFHITQLLCHKICTSSGVTNSAPARLVLGPSLASIIEDVMIDLALVYKEPALTFARGSKLRPEGRAPYLHILRWLSESEDWSLDISEAMRTHPESRLSVGQVLDKGYLNDLLTDPEKGPILQPHFHFEHSTRVISVEDPKFVFYLKNLVWRAFTRQAGYKADQFKFKYDFALSFAGADRAVADKLNSLLAEREVACFYDKALASDIVAENLEEYLAPIYQSEARFVLPLLSPAYPTRIWTKFESDKFKERFGTKSVIPIRYKTAVPGYFSDEQAYGALSFDPAGDVDAQLTEIAETLCERMLAERQSGGA